VQELDGSLTPTSVENSVQNQRGSLVQRPDIAESTGDIAEKEADDVTLAGYETPRQHPTDSGPPSKPKGSVTDYPPLTDEAGKEAAARERDRQNAYRTGGIRFAPWNIPYRRRLQTLAVVVHCLSIAVTVSFFFFLCAIPLTWPILIPYLLHMLLSKSATDGRLRARSERFRRLPVWNFFADYFPARLHKTHPLPPTRKYIFGYHPHGIISHGAFAAFATESLGFSEKFPGITNSLLTLDSNFRIPLYRDYILALGIQSVSKESIEAILTTGGVNGEGMGRAVTIVVGGARESLEAQPGTLRLVLAQRKGFVKMALRTGADLVPVLAFGENDLYDQVNPQRHPLLHALQMWVLRTLKYTLPFLHGRGIFNYDVGLMPYRRPLNVVVGRPIPVRQVREERMMDSREVDRLHAEYVGELERMWEVYKGVFAPGRRDELRILK
jgi:2-acylglycerol O-acyltransferase 2